MGNFLKDFFELNYQLWQESRVLQPNSVRDEEMQEVRDE